MNLKSWISKNLIKNNKRPTVIGITGTVGKTTTIELLYNYLDNLGKKVFCVSTAGIKCNTKYAYNISDLQSTSFHLKKELAIQLNRAIQENCEYILLEVTAETLSEGVYDELEFDISALNMFKYDVCQSFNSNEEYLEAKIKLFEKNRSKKIIINSNSAEFLNKIKIFRDDIICFGSNFKNIPASYFIDYYSISNFGTMDISFNTVKDIIFNTNLVSINKDNLLCFFSIISELNLLDTKKLIVFLKNISVRGRYTRFKLGTREVVIDTGYNGIDGMRDFVNETPNRPTILITSVYNFTSVEINNRPQIINFRKEKGKYCQENFKDVILTSTNRGCLKCELKNIEDIASTCPKAIKIYDRFEAIKTAWEMSKPGDRIFITGKGTESNIQLGRINLDDEDIIRLIAKCFPKEKGK